MSWTMTDTPAGAHIVPEDDLIVHQESPDCACSPAVEHVGDTCMCTGKLYIRTVVTHQAMDGRPDE